MSFVPDTQQNFTNQSPRSQNGGTPEQAVATTSKPPEAPGTVEDTATFNGRGPTFGGAKK